ncbi:hypothetical protein M0534_01745 [Methylonatrum kenyense]|uniref:hypothetical protein n=1 Tax=Methylonatrum kenyense TaxID=455253 RepID=UPI0020BDE39A|nr:hypothetical protein [Methylonatrum kenyense]MCK8515055.1 hypothetical protein [Methylonatrum kenyense]
MTRCSICEIDNAVVFIAVKETLIYSRVCARDRFWSSGKAHVTDADGGVTSADKAWRFVKDDSGDLRIEVHHSPLAYEGA